jgi:hypothetical protein
MNFEFMPGLKRAGLLDYAGRNGHDHFTVAVLFLSPSWWDGVKKV